MTNYHFNNRLAFFSGILAGVALMLCLQLLTATYADTPTEGPTPTATPAADSHEACSLIASADDPAAWATLRSIWGTLDYDGGLIYAVNEHEVIGYAATEDGDIWNLPQCTN